jgi:DNA repair exonuclease SbcCD nuclease subunit
MKLLYVGDMHVTPSKLDECNRLIQLIDATATAKGVDLIVLLGDQFHTHSVIHLSVLSFWQSALRTLAKTTPVAVIVGNHDRSGDESDTANAMMTLLGPRTHIVDGPTVFENLLVMCPYYDRPEHLVNGAALYPDVPVLVCHQTFQGSTYENGFYAKDGLDPNLIPQKLIISGHIHTPQSFDKVWYPGSPRWQSISDANVQRAIWYVEHAADGSIIDKQAIPTNTVCRAIYSFEDREGTPMVLPEGDDVSILVDVYGTPKYVEERAAQLEAKGCRVRQFPTIVTDIRVRESDGLPDSFKKFVRQFKPHHGTAPERLLTMASDRISWMKGAV